MKWKSFFRALAVCRVPVTELRDLCPPAAPHVQPPAVQAAKRLDRYIRFSREDLQIFFLRGREGLRGSGIGVGDFPKADLRSREKPNCHPDKFSLCNKAAISIYGNAGNPENHRSMKISKISYQKPTNNPLT